MGSYELCHQPWSHTVVRLSHHTTQVPVVYPITLCASSYAVWSVVGLGSLQRLCGMSTTGLLHAWVSHDSSLYTNALHRDPHSPPRGSPGQGWTGCDVPQRVWPRRRHPIDSHALSERWKCSMWSPRPPRCTGATLRAFLRRTRLDSTSPAAHVIEGRPNTLPQVLTLQHLHR